MATIYLLLFHSDQLRLSFKSLQSYVLTSSKELTPRLLLIFENTPIASLFVWSIVFYKSFSCLCSLIQLIAGGYLSSVATACLMLASSGVTLWLTNSAHQCHGRHFEDTLDKQGELMDEMVAVMIHLSERLDSELENFSKNMAEQYSQHSITTSIDDNVRILAENVKLLKERLDGLSGGHEEKEPENIRNDLPDTPPPSPSYRNISPASYTISESQSSWYRSISLPSFPISEVRSSPSYHSISPPTSPISEFWNSQPLLLRSQTQEEMSLVSHPQDGFYFAEIGSEYDYNNAEDFSEHTVSSARYNSEFVAISGENISEYVTATEDQISEFTSSDDNISEFTFSSSNHSSEGSITSNANLHTLLDKELSRCHITLEDEPSRKSWALSLLSEVADPFALKIGCHFAAHFEKMRSEYNGGDIDVNIMEVMRVYSVYGNEELSRFMENYIEGPDHFDYFEKDDGEVDWWTEGSSYGWDFFDSGYYCEEDEEDCRRFGLGRKRVRTKGKGGR
ncbi:hypothetical protein RUND412_009815 [Rhizina undulata]